MTRAPKRLSALAAVLATLAGGLWLSTGCAVGGGEPLALPTAGASFAAEGPVGTDAEGVEGLVAGARGSDALAGVAIDAPLDGAVFPPEMVAPTVVFVDPAEGVSRWLVHVALPDDGGHLYVLTDGEASVPEREIDPRCVTGTNNPPPTPRELARRGWTPDPAAWERMKAASVERPLTVTVYGLDGRRVRSQGSVRLSTSADPVAAQLFYRDVPLMPAENTEGVVNPIGTGALPLIAWRIRDLGEPRSKVVMEGLPTCANCHSFSADGRTLGMDMDGPQGDKGAYALASVAPRTVVESHHVFSWNDYNPDKVTFGLFSRVSPDGRFVVSSVDEEVFVANYLDYRFLQTFYPTRGILAVYDRETGRIGPLPGADDPAFVHCNPVWSPDGSTIAFLRAPAMDARQPGMEMPTHANDPREPRIRYDIYTIPFNDGRGGRAEPLPGASANGKSNSFPKYSPDGRWLVWVQADNGLLMRPDSRLFIVPAGGGEARPLESNLEPMSSWHSWSPNSRWLAFSSKARSPFTQMYLTHVDADGRASPPVLVPGSTAANRAVNLPEFANVPPGGLDEILTPAVDYRRRLDRATALRDEGELAASEAELRAALELRPDFAETRRIFASVLAEQGRFEEAIAAYRALLEDEPDNAPSLSNLGFLLDHEGRTGEAVDCYRRSIELDPRNPTPRLNLGAIHARTGDLDAAEAELRAALELEPGNPAALRLAGLVAERQGRTGRAVELYERCLAVDPTRADVRRRLALAYLHLGQSGRALPHLELLVRAHPGDPAGHRHLGLALDRQGRFEEAVRHFARAAELDPDDHVAFEGGGIALAHAGRLDEAEAKLRRAVELEPGSATARSNLDKVLRERTGGS